jgi:AcrR family transcriptional regulator
VAYRRTVRVEARLAATRERVIEAALALVAEGGWAVASIAAVAARAGISTGAVYRYFASKGELCAEVFRRASQHELDVLVSVAARPGQAADERLAAVVSTFVRRALEGRRLAYALLAEPVDPAVEAERLRFRRRYRELFAGLVAAAARAGAAPQQDADLAAAALVGAVAETLLGPLAPDTGGQDPERLVGALTRLALRTVGVEAMLEAEHAH